MSKKKKISNWVVVLVVEGSFLAVVQDAGQGLDALTVDPSLDFGLN
jgi:hypothetical protein